MTRSPDDDRGPIYWAVVIGYWCLMVALVMAWVTECSGVGRG